MSTIIRNLRRALVATSLLLAVALYSNAGSVSKEQVPGGATLSENAPQWPPPPKVA